MTDVIHILLLVAYLVGSCLCFWYMVFVVINSQFFSFLLMVSHIKIVNFLIGAIQLCLQW